MFSEQIFRANDIRGRYLADFDSRFTKNLAQALRRLCEQKKIPAPQFLVGHDARLSSPEISQTLIKELKNQGISLCFIGLAPSPLCYFLLQHYNLTACVVVTASHNPKEYNGFKILFHKKYKIFRPVESLKPLCLQKESLSSHSKPLKKGVEFKVEKEEPYISSLKKEFSLKPLPFIIDTGNGALGPLAKKTFSALGLQPECLFCEPDGRFPHHHPDPIVEDNLSALKQRVLQGGFKLGLGFDGDGDRLALVDEKGRAWLGDDLGWILLKSLQKSKSLYVLADVKCSDWLFRSANKAGFKMLMGQGGQGRIRARMEQTGALMAIEFSGHIFFNDRPQRGFDDALYASLRLLEILNVTPGQELLRLLPRISTVRTGEIRLSMPEQKALSHIEKIKAYLRKRGEVFKEIDGVRLSRKEGWALFRTSKTESALSMRFEAGEAGELESLKQEFAKVMGCPIP